MGWGYPLPTSYIPGCGAVLTEPLKEAFPVNPDKRKHTKWDRWARLVMVGYDLFYINDHLFFYRMTEDNLSGIGKKVNDARTSDDFKSVPMLMLENYWGAT